MPAEEVINVEVPATDEDGPLGGMADQGPRDIPFLESSLPCKYLKKEMIGRGAFGEAFMVERQSDKKMFVGKEMDLSNMSPKDKQYTSTEILCLAHARHFAIIQYVEHQLVDEDTVVIVMEFADNGDLSNNIKKNAFKCTEEEAAVYFVQLLLALDHIHRRRMIHRDIKSANVFMTKCGLIKLGDFGFSQQYDQTVSGDCATTFLGTPYYLSPEMWEGNRYGKKADVWAACIVLCEFLTGQRPFVAPNMTQLKKNVIAGVYSLPEELSIEMREFVRGALHQDPLRRPSAQALLRAPLMQRYLQIFRAQAAANPAIPPETKVLIEKNIQDSLTAKEEEVETIPKNNAYYEGVVYKESDGVWKERYLILSNGYLCLALAKAKEGGGSEKSKKISCSTMLSAVPVSGTTCGKFSFAISTENSSAIVFATKNEKERDDWVEKLLIALGLA